MSKYTFLKPKKKKTHTREQCLELAQKISKLRMLRDYGRLWCVSCGVPLGTDAQGGHLIPRQDRAVETEPDNIWVQCPRCNTFLGGNYKAYRERLIGLIGIERVQRIEDMSSARKGSEEALSRLSEEDREKALMRKSAYFYECLWQELNEELKRLREQI